MTRFAFFGMHGVYSATLLRALLTAELKPALVVVGVDKPKHHPSPIVRAIPARPTLWQRLFGAAPDTNAGRGPGVVDLAELAQGAGIDAVITSDPDLLSVRAALFDAAVEAFVVAGFPRLLSPRVLALAPRGGLNVHPGKLPAERGPAPVFWALKAGRTKLYVTVHVLDEGEDSGDVVSSALFTFDPGTDGVDVHRRAAHAAAPLLLKAVRALFAGDLVRTPQPRTGVGRCPRPTFRDGAIDRTKRAEEVFTFVAGCARHYSLFVEIAGDRFFVRDAVGYDAGATLPSEYVVSGNTLILRCADGVVDLELKPEGAIFSATYTDE